MERNGKDWSAPAYHYAHHQANQASDFLIASITLVAEMCSAALVSAPRLHVLHVGTTCCTDSFVLVLQIASPGRSWPGSRLGNKFVGLQRKTTCITFNVYTSFMTTTAYGCNLYPADIISYCGGKSELNRA
jgi:hypothetical protein